MTLLLGVMDALARGHRGLVGIRGVLRDYKSDVKLVFPKYVGVGGSNFVELLSVREGFLLFISSQWVVSHKLIIESDSINALKWVLNPTPVPWRIKHMISHIENLKLFVVMWSICHTLREANSVADNLAKVELRGLTIWDVFRLLAVAEMFDILSDRPMFLWSLCLNLASLVPVASVVEDELGVAGAEQERDVRRSVRARKPPKWHGDYM
ncbi:hypothetical protein PTKIN_Ptkin16aG0056100 [Pterospermum kingtungense]